MTRIHSHTVRKWRLNQLAKLDKWFDYLVSTICTMHLILSSHHLTYAFQNEPTPYSCLNLNGLQTGKKRYIWKLSDCNRTRNHNHFVCKRTLKLLAKLGNWLSCVVSTDLRLSDWTGTHNNLVCNQNLKHLSKRSKSLSCVVDIYLWNVFDCMFWSCHVRASEWIHTLKLPEYQESPSLKQIRYLKIKFLQQDSKPQRLTS